MNNTGKITAVCAAALLLLAGCGTEDADAIEVVADDFSFDPTSISVDTDEEVAISLNNEGSAEHSFTAEGLGIDIEADGGNTTDGSFTAPSSDGTFPFICKFHPGQMRGEVVVGAGGAAPGGTDDDDENEFDNVTPGDSPPEGTTEGEDEYDDGY